jgi:hypothetical protein
MATTTSRQDGDIVWFGIGCFHFGYQKATPFEFKRRDYIRDLKLALESITAVDNISITVPKDEENIEVATVTEPPATLTEGGPFFPHFSSCMIRFELYIPERVQLELGGKDARTEIGTERFIVFIGYTYYGPVAFIVLLDPTPGDRNPTTAVQVVRDFIQRELRPDTTSIRFQYLGPSPFHADCSVTLRPQVSRGGGTFRVEHQRKDGYDELRFSSDHSEYKTGHEATTALFSEIEDELGLYYWITRRQVRAVNHWNQIQEDLSALEATRSRLGVWRTLASARGRSKKLREVFTALIDFDVTRIFDQNSQEEAYRSTYRKSSGFVRAFVDQQIKDAVRYPTKQIATLVGFLERRRSKTMELAVVLFAAIIGGIAGAGITRFSNPSLPQTHPESVRAQVSPSIVTSSSPTASPNP